jgi:hypothetical protein
MKARRIPKTWRLERSENGNGDLNVIVDDFVYVTIHYDYRFTCNSHQWALGRELINSLSTAGDLLEEAEPLS